VFIIAVCIRRWVSIERFPRSLVQKALDQGASYADARRVRRRTETFSSATESWSK